MLPADYTVSGNSIVIDTGNIAYDVNPGGTTFVTHYTYNIVDQYLQSVTRTATINLIEV